MKTVPCIALTEGMILAEDVLSHKNEVLASAGSTINASIIAKFKRFDVMCVNIKDAEELSDTHFQKIQANVGFQHFTETYKSCISVYKQYVQNMIQNKVAIPKDALLGIYHNMLSCARTSEELLDYLYNRQLDEDELTYAHCMNSALLAGIFASWLSFSEADKETAILCGFYYDIGKILLPAELLWKSGKLTDLEYTEMKTHTMRAFQVIRDLDVPDEVLRVTLTHHEKCDGSGYPSHLKEHQISKFAKFIAIVDSYEAMTSARTYRKPLHIFEVINSFQKEGFEKYEITFLLPLLQKLASLKVGSNVRLSDGSTAQIMMLNPSQLSRPIIRMEEGALIDLKNEPFLCITSFL